MIIKDGKKYLIPNDLNFDWMAGEVRFDCPCGESHEMFESGDRTKCQCGRVYVLIHVVVIEDSNFQASISNSSETGLIHVARKRYSDLADQSTNPYGLTIGEGHKVTW